MEFEQILKKAQDARQSADFRDAILRDACLRDWDLHDADLSGANLSGADLSDARLIGTHLNETVYQPNTNPPGYLIAKANGLDRITWQLNSKAVYALRQIFEGEGFHDAARQVTAAINRNDENLLQRMFFDWTCEWGASPLRPLKIVTLLWILSAVIYRVGMKTGKRSNVYRVTAGRQPTVASTSWSTAFVFSMMNVFNLEFGDFKTGHWVRMLQPHEYGLSADGWMRTVAGIQSLLSMALIVLSAVSYFGHPFE